MELTRKSFYELSLDELHEIYRLRAEVFVVEQACIYQDVDQADKKAIHFWIKDGDDMIAYLRLLPEGILGPAPTIGRVLSLRRRTGLATALIQEAVTYAKKELHAHVLCVYAQTYARQLYEKVGFVPSSEEYIEDGIPHIKMLLDL